MKKCLMSVVVFLAGLLLVAPAQAKDVSGELEIFSWWSGDEGPALEKLMALYQQHYPKSKLINATVAGGSGVNAKAVLKTRMLGGNPPDSFQVHAGQELIGTWVTSQRMEDLTDLYKQQGWMDAFPKDLIKLLGTDQGIWSVPVNIHRSNVLWYNPTKLAEWGVTPPATWDDFLAMAPGLKAKGVTPLSLGATWTASHLFESVALAAVGPDNWEALWSGKLPWTSPEGVRAWELFGKVLAFTNDDAASLSWQQATDMVVDGRAAFNVMGDWAAGYMGTTLKLEAGKGFGWAPSPDTAGEFMFLADSFGLPKGAPHRDAAIAWLELLGSKEGSDAFNPLKGSISARLDSDLSLYSAYSQSAAGDFGQNRIVGSLVHGVVANEGFMNDFASVMGMFLKTRNAQQAATATQAIADRNGIGK